MQFLIYFSFKRANNVLFYPNMEKKKRKRFNNINAVYIPPAISKVFIDEARKNNELKKGIRLFILEGYQEKRVDVLIKAYKTLNIDAELKIIGDGEELENLKLLACDNNKIKFTGFLEDDKLFNEIKKSKTYDF